MKKGISKRLIKKMNKPKLSELIKEADRLFSLLVRQKAADENGLVRCCTCRKPHHWKKIQCGHFMSRACMSTRYDEKNVGCQDIACNIFLQGNQYEFSLYLDKKYGEGTAEATKLKSKMSCKRSTFDLQYMINEFKQELISRGFETR